MNRLQFVIRVIFLELAGIAASTFGGIATPWSKGMLVGAGLALSFTFLSEYILRGKLWGKIGPGMITIYFVHLTGETLVYVALLLLSGFAFDIAVINHTVFIVTALACWAMLCREALAELLRLILLFIATRR